MISSKYNTDVYTDFQGLNSLKAAAGKNSPQALEKVAEQFEAIFLQTMLKSMRSASLGEGIMDNDQSKFYQEMFDQQIAMDLAKKKQVGIAEMMVRQLSQQQASTATMSELDQSRIKRSELNIEPINASPVSSSDSDEKDLAPGFETPQAFVQRLWPAAEKAAAELGVAPEVLLAQSALETGWGKSVIQKSDGRSSYNLFNIKADHRWSGESAQVSTLEYDGTVAKREMASFRAYDSYEESFGDYVAFVKSGARYQQALQQAGDGAAYVRELQDAGYATDPNYANKINRIVGSEQFSDWVAELKKQAV